ncbi:hypothetical protein H0H93_010568 [Arthromyces matolae]|nr:hypothetical protein H0H93_010568 [Arthromyces matolae]
MIAHFAWSSVGVGFKKWYRLVLFHPPFIIWLTHCDLSEATGSHQVQRPTESATLSINDLLRPDPADPRTYPRQTSFSVDELGTFQARVDKCTTYKDRLNVSQKIVGDLIVTSRANKMNPDDAFLCALKIRRMAILKEDEDIKERRVEKPERWESTLRHHCTRMTEMAANYRETGDSKDRTGNQYVQERTKAIVDDLQSRLEIVESKWQRKRKNRQQGEGIDKLNR